MAPHRFSVKKLALIALLLDEESESGLQPEESELRPKEKRLWVHKALRKRKEEGEYWTLYKELEDDEVKFFQYFRMSKSKFSCLLEKVEGDLLKKNTSFREAIPPKEKLAVCLRFLATGDSFRTISLSYRLGHSTVHNIVKEVCSAIIKRLQPEVMPPPTQETWKQIATDFWDRWNFPNCIGAIGGKHIKIQAPPNSGSQFFNYKQTFSIVLFGLVDAHYRFIAVDIGSFDKNSDGGIFSHSKLGMDLEKGVLNIPQAKELPGTTCLAPYVMAGNEAFPLKTYLMRPYPGSQSIGDAQKTVFNFRLSRARQVVENAFGILSKNFQVYQRTLKSLPDNLENIVFATCILHNFMKDQNDSDILTTNSTCMADSLVDIGQQGDDASQNALIVREKFKQFFSSPSGSVPWM